MTEPAPVLTVDLFPLEREALLDLLGGLSEDDWHRLTVCPGWSVKDIALHIPGDDLSMVSRKRDGHVIAGDDLDSWESLVAFLNDWNERWVDVREGRRWRLESGAASGPAASVRLDDDTAWRRWTKGIDRETAQLRTQIDGDRALGTVALDAVAIIA